MKKVFRLLFFLLAAHFTQAAANDKLTGTVMGTPTTGHACLEAFDGNPETFYASQDDSYAWVGLDLGQPHVISRVGWMPRNVEGGAERVVLGVFEGANREDFMDALPLFIITEGGIAGTMSQADVNCSRGFRYVRYVGPSEAYCNIAEVEFYGQPGEGDDSALFRLTNQPTVTIHTLDGEIPYDKEHDISALITIIGPDGATQLSEPGTVRERGNGSRTFPKRPYRLKFEQKKRVLDAPAKAKVWNLVSNYSDKALMRNLLAFEMSRCFGMPFTPYAQSVDVLLNGEYKGTYLLCDALKVEKNRIELETMKPEDISGEALTGGYLVEIDAYAYEENCWFSSEMGNPVTIQYPSDDEIVPEQQAYIEGAFNRMENDWETYLDMNTFLRHFLIGELSGNTDTYWSVYMYKHRGDDAFYTGPVWDFDLAFENDYRTFPINDKTDFVYRSGGSCCGQMKEFVDRIAVYSDAAREQMLNIWAEARQDKITAQYLLDFIDRYESNLQQTQRLNFLRWPIMDIKVQKNPVVWGGYAEEVQNVRRYLQERLEWMDNKLGYEEPSGINSTAYSDLKDKDTWYSLDGRKLNGKPTVKGLYIHNGRKVVIM